MNDNAQLPAGFTAVDPDHLSAVEGGLNPIGDFLDGVGRAISAVGSAISTVGKWINGLF